MPLAIRERAERILFIRGGAIGDFILTLPAVRLLREKLPGHYIEILGYPSISQVAVDWGLADRIAPLEHGGLARFFVPGAQLDERWSAYFASFNVVISYLFDPDGYFHGNLRRAGVTKLLIGPHKPANDGPPAALQLAKPLEELAMCLSREDAQRPFVAGRAWSNGSKKVALHPGSGSPAKNWGYENWRGVCHDLATQAGAAFLIISGEAEHATIPDLIAMLEADRVPHEHLHSGAWPKVAESLAPCRLFLGHDSGISHFAAACSVPCLVVFGPTNPRVWAPLQRTVEVITSPSGKFGDLSCATVSSAALRAIDKAAAI